MDGTVSYCLIVSKTVSINILLLLPGVVAVIKDDAFRDIALVTSVVLCLV